MRLSWSVWKEIHNVHNCICCYSRKKQHVSVFIFMWARIFIYVPKRARIRFVYVICVFSAIKAYQVLSWGLTKEHNSVKHIGGVTVLRLCTLSDDALHLYYDKNLQTDIILWKCRWSYCSWSLQIVWWCFIFIQSFRGFRVIEWTRNHDKIYKGHIIPQTIVGGITVHDHRTSCDDALYLEQVSWKYLKGFQRYWADTKSWRTDKRTHRRTDRWLDKIITTGLPPTSSGPFRVFERIRNHDKNLQKGIICTKFCENISKRLCIIERKRNHDKKLQKDIHVIL